MSIPIQSRILKRDHSNEHKPHKGIVCSNNISVKRSNVPLFSLYFSHLCSVVFWRWESLEGRVAIPSGIFLAKVDGHEDAENAGHSRDGDEGPESLEVTRTLRRLA